MGVKIKKKHNPEKIHSAHIPSPVDEDIKTAVATVLVKNKDGSEEKVSSEEAVVHGKGPFANIGVRLGRTINLGQFNSAKVEVSINVPCPLDESEINQTFVFASEWVDIKMGEVVSKITSAGLSGGEDGSDS